MDRYTIINIATSLVVLCGAFILLITLFAWQTMKDHIPHELSGRWRLMTMLTQFFLAGYVLFCMVLASRVSIPTELITAPVFLAGAVFVFFVIRLTRDTIRSVKRDEGNLQLLNESLEQRVRDRTRDLLLLGESLDRRINDRTRDLDRSREFLQTVLDSLYEEVMIVDADTYSIVRANAAFLARHAVEGDSIIGKTCHEILHNRHEVCAMSEEICPLTETVKTGAHATAEHVHFDAQGYKRYVEVSSSPIRDANGRVAQIVHVARDITARRMAEEGMRESEERYRRLIELSPEGISIQVDGNFVFVNLAGMRLLGAVHADQLIGMAALNIVHPDYGEIEKARLEQLDAAANKASWTEERYVRLDGGLIDVEVASVRFSYQGKQAVQTIFRDITDRKQAAQRIEHLALHDPLTGLPNRILFFDLIHQILAEAKRNRNIFALLYIDVDDFKPINDMYGHETGDQLLREVSKRLVASVRESDPIARIGGDEFVGICRTITMPEEAELVARKIIAGQSEPFDLKGHRCSVGVSIGISVYPTDGEDAGTLLQRADEAMYRVKKSGKGRYLRYSKQ